MDLSLTCVISTQLWHHIYLGGGLCDLPTWEAMAPSRNGELPSLDLDLSGRPVELSATAT
jgi:asparagine synthase (glutamine-hydrolysing)